MGDYGRQSDLGRFIIQEAKSYNAICSAIKNFSLKYKEEIEFENDELITGYIEVEDIYFQFATNVTIIENCVSFDAIIEAHFSAHKKYKDDFDDISGTQWFRLNCEMFIEDKLSAFAVKSVNIYSKGEKKNLQFAATSNFVPIIRKEEFDSEAERILKKYYPQALTSPMPVPIDEIARNMGLKIIETEKLSHNFSIFGQICFSEGIVKVYDENTKSYRDIQAERGTIFIDPDTFYLRNLGCANNTKAHEMFHWERHRIYATIKSILTKQPSIACRCPTAPKGNIIRDVLTEDEDWMEWQANGVAPRILMPKYTTEIKIKELINKYDFQLGISDSSETLKMIVDELALFFQVSKQAAKIRMIELGYDEVSKIYNYEAELTYQANEIDLFEALNQYNINNVFRTIIDLQLFRYVEGYFVVDNEKYTVQNESGIFVLTNYAKENIAECSLQFTYNLVELCEYNKNRGILYRNTGGRYGNVPNYEHDEQNEAIFDVAAEAVRFSKEYEENKIEHETFCGRVWNIMQRKKWNSTIFKDKTLLTDDMYSKLKRNPNHRPDLLSVIAICVGLDLDYKISMELIEKAGYALVATDVEHKAYEHILTPVFRGVPIDTRNGFLEILSKNSITKGDKPIRKLGSFSHGESRT